MGIFNFRRQSKKETKEAKQARLKAEKEQREAEEAKKKADEEKRIHNALKPYITGDKIDVDKALDAGIHEKTLLAAGVSKSDIKLYKEGKKLERQTRKDELKLKQAERKLKKEQTKTKLIQAQTAKRAARAKKTNALVDDIESKFKVVKAVTGTGSTRRRKKKHTKSPLRKKAEKGIRSIRINV